MSNLDSLLKDTLLLTAAPGAKYQSFEKGAARGGGSTSGTGATWGWTHAASRADRVTGVTHRLRATPWFPAQTLTVLEELVWHPIEVVHRGVTLKLELTEEFLLRRYEASRGSVAPEQSRFWLPATLDRSMLLVFGFQVNLRAPAGTVTLERIPSDVLERDDFMPFADAKPPALPEMKVKRTETGTLQLTPLRVLVCAEFVCCAERADYTPGGLAATSRFRPHLMFISNRPLDRMAAAISIRRPAVSGMSHPGSHPKPPPGEPHAPHDGHGSHGMHALDIPPTTPPAPGPGTPLDDPDGMVHEMAAGFWSDSNEGLVCWQNLKNLSGPPLWGSMFSRVRTDVPAGAGYLMASPQASQGEQGRGTPGFNSWLWNGSQYVAYQQTLMPRQGYFDNIHIAPPMKAPPSFLERFGKLGYHLDRIAMAPFCIHDCLHLHWRWLPTGPKEKHLWGWGESGPYTAEGEPHIPPHQHLRVEMESTHAFAYRVQADQGLVAGRWQYVLHEGLAYGNSAANEDLAKMMHLGMQVLDGLPTSLGDSWALFYWALRYSYSGGGVHERLLTDGAPLP
jgi:hypothetical protein